MLQEPDEEAKHKYNAVLPVLGRFQRRAAPQVFMWVEWVVILSLLQYVEDRTGAWPVAALFWVLSALLWQYFISYFSGSYRWRPYREIFSAGGLVNWALALGATAAMVGASFWFAAMFAANPY